MRPVDQLDLAIDERGRKIVIVGDAHEREPAFAAQPDQRGAQLRAAVIVEARERLVEHERLRLRGNRAREHDPPRLPAAQLVDPARAEVLRIETHARNACHTPEFDAPDAAVDLGADRRPQELQPRSVGTPRPPARRLT